MTSETEARNRWLRQSDRAITQMRARALLGCGCSRCVRAWRDADDMADLACENGKASLLGHALIVRAEWRASENSEAHG